MKHTIPFLLVFCSLGLFANTATAEEDAENVSESSTQQTATAEEVAEKVSESSTQQTATAEPDCD